MGNKGKLPKKVTKEELSKLQGIVQAINEVQIEIGSVEVQKAQMLNAILNFRLELQEYQKTLKDKYGDVNVSIVDGSLKLKEDDKAN